jgi:hypothetical protein
MENKCGDCCNFIQHYALKKGKPYKVYFRHCTIFSVWNCCPKLRRWQMQQNNIDKLAI